MHLERQGLAGSLVPFRRSFVPNANVCVIAGVRAYDVISKKSGTEAPLISFAARDLFDRKVAVQGQG